MILGDSKSLDRDVSYGEKRMGTFTVENSTNKHWLKNLSEMVVKRYDFRTYLTPDCATNLAKIKRRFTEYTLTVNTASSCLMDPS